MKSGHLIGNEISYLIGSPIGLLFPPINPTFCVFFDNSMTHTTPQLFRG